MFGGVATLRFGCGYPTFCIKGLLLVERGYASVPSNPSRVGLRVRQGLLSRVFVCYRVLVYVRKKRTAILIPYCGSLFRFYVCGIVSALRALQGEHIVL